MVFFSFSLSLYFTSYGTIELLDKLELTKSFLEFPLSLFYCC